MGYFSVGSKKDTGSPGVLPAKETMSELPSPSPEDEYTFRGGLLGGKLDIAALLEEHLMPDGFDPDDIDPEQIVRRFLTQLAPRPCVITLC